MSLIAIIFLVAVQIVFSIPAPYKCLEAVWSAGDFITFCGTVTLGIITCVQTHKANEMSQALMRIEENRDQLEISPFFMVTQWEMRYLVFQDMALNNSKRVSIDIGNSEEKTVGLILKIQNTTKSFITVEYMGAQIETDGKWTNAGCYQFNRKLLLKEGENGEINFYASENFIKNLESKRCKLKFILENRFAQRYEEEFILIITYITDNEKEIFCHCQIQEYEIKRYNMQKEEKKSKKDKFKENISKKINKLLRRKGIIRFAKKNIFLSVMFGITVIISIIYYWKFLDNDKFLYKSIFNLIYNVSLAYIGSVVVYYITDFMPKDKIYIRYEKKIQVFLEEINYKMKKINYIILDKKIDWREELKTIYKKDLKEKKYVLRKRNADDSWKDDKAPKINRIEKEISDKVTYIMTTFRGCISEDDIQLLIDIQNTKLKERIEKLEEEFNGRKFGVDISIEEFEDHIEKQNMLEKRIQELEKEHAA